MVLEPTKEVGETTEASVGEPDTVTTAPTGPAKEDPPPEQVKVNPPTSALPMATRTGSEGLEWVTLATQSVGHAQPDGAASPAPGTMLYA